MVIKKFWVWVVVVLLMVDWCVVVLLLMVDQWVVVLLMVDWWVVIGKFWVDRWVVVLLMVGLIWVWEVDELFGVWDEFLCWVCLGFGINFCAEFVWLCARGIGFSLWYLTIG